MRDVTGKAQETFSRLEIYSTNTVLYMNETDGNTNP